MVLLLSVAAWLAAGWLGCALMDRNFRRCYGPVIGPLTWEWWLVLAGPLNLLGALLFLGIEGSGR